MINRFAAANIMKLNREDVLQIKAILHETWGIRGFRNHEEWSRELNSLPTETVNRYWALHEEQAGYLERKKKVPASLELKWYEFLGTQPVAGVVHSHKYPFTLDTAAAVVAMCRAVGAKGPILDIGCHIGYHPDIYEKLLGLEVFAIEASQAAISTARSVLGDRERIHFIRADHSKIELPKVQVITCVDAFPYSRGDIALMLSKFIDAITKDGFIVLAGNLLDIAPGDLSKVCKHLGLGMLAHGVTGGWISPLNTYENRIWIVLGKSKTAVPRNLYMNWDGFPEYANSTLTPFDEKTQAFFHCSDSAS